jgi:alpha-galactosidase
MIKRIFFPGILIISLFCFHCTGKRDASANSGSLILTPQAGPSPKINGPKIYGIRPGSPFLYRIPCTGRRPIIFSAENLPEGLSLDIEKGLITGNTTVPGEYKVLLKAKNETGEDSREFKIVVGDGLALTPPMGWNSWYIHYDRVSEQVMREAANQMIASGMADYGYQYVNIDDCWMVKTNSDDPEIGGKPRDENGILLANARFPDIRGMTDYIHAKGLKAGTYITPGPRTCAGYEGSYGHESTDAATFAEWGFDFLKYDWCYYTEKVNVTTPDDYIEPYRIMSEELKKQDRDIVLNLCQYGMSEVWKWGGSVGHSWRTTGDLGLEKPKDLPGFYYIGFSNAAHWEYAQPGAWNDPDYILIGWVGDANTKGIGTLTTLTPHEQYSYMSMWCLMAAPLIFSGDMSKLDPFTLNVLCNHEVIDIDQDPSGKQARIIRHSETDFVLAKELEGGSLAVGIFNLADHPSENDIRWTDLGIEGKKKARDLWRQKDVGSFKDSYATSIPPHGVSLIKLTGN